MAIYDPLAWMKNIPPAPAGGTKKWKWNGKKWVPKGKPALPGKDNTPAPATPATPSGYSGGGGYGSGGGGGSGSGGGGGAPAGLSAYIQYYREHYFANGKPPASLLKQAKKDNWSVSYFAQRVRLSDPHYLQSREARVLLPAFSRAMRSLFPGLADKTRQAQLMKSPFYKKAALWYMRNGVGLSSGGGLESLYGHITGTKQWNQANPYWKAYAANKNINVQTEQNPLVYKQLMSTLKQSFTDAGMEVPDDYYNSFAKSRYASSEGMKGLSQNLSDLVQKGSSFGWMEGAPLTEQQTKKELFGGDVGATDLRSRLTRGFNMRGSFLSKEQAGPESTLSKRGQLVNPLL